MTSSGSAESAARAASPDAEQRLRQEIEQKREQLGDTVEALAAKADVKARARVWLAGRLNGTAARSRAAAAAQAGALRGRLAATTARDRQQAAAAAAITLIAGYLVTRSWMKQ
mgnify:CR=1 FL=1